MFGGIATDDDNAVQAFSGYRKGTPRPFDPDMKYLIHMILTLAVAGGTYMWLTAEIPGGEKRYEHYIREAKDRANVRI